MAYVIESYASLVKKLEKITLEYTSQAGLDLLAPSQPKKSVLYTTLRSALGLGRDPHITNLKRSIVDSEPARMIRYTHELHSNVLSMISKKGCSGLSFEKIDFGQTIDENILLSIINILDGWNNPSANLVSGLLLEGRIRSVSNEKDDPEAYWEKRIHDAITFYGKAATEKTLKPTVDFILWEIKTTSTIPSVQIRLSPYDLTPPPSYIPTWSSFKTARSDVSFTLPNIGRTLFFKPESISEQHIAEEINLTSQQVTGS